MNRDLIPQGRTKQKWAETLSIFGGAGAIIYPPILYYMGYMSIIGKDDFLFCELTTRTAKIAAGEDY